MKKLLLSIVIIAAALLPTTVLAHVLKTDGNIGAVLHVDPADDPEVGKPASFFFEFKDKENKFELSKCDCKVSIAKGGVEVYSGVLGGIGGLGSPLFQYTFIERGIYTIKATGTPKVAGDFQSFALNYDLRVDRGGAEATVPSTDSANSGGGHTLHFILLGGAVLAVFGKYAFDILKKRKALKKTTQNVTVGLVAAFALFGLLFHQVHAAGSNCAGRTLPSAHECCLPVLADTSVPLKVEKIKPVSDTVVALIHGISLEIHESINNKSPPIV